MFQNKYDIIVIGAGPAGLMAAIESYNPSKKTVILEKMPNPALKLKISGKGRCNITNDADLKEFISHFGKNGRFLKFAFAEFFNTDLLEYFEILGIRFKLERGGRYFPESDRATAIANALLNRARSLGIPIAVNSEVTDIKKLPGGTFAVTIKRKERAADKNPRRIELMADRIVLATGGKSYPLTGSSGAGFELASKLGHTVTPLFPALVPLKTEGDTAKRLQGLSLRNVNVGVWCQNRKIDERFGEMLFADFGVSGPVILSLSGAVVRLIDDGQKVFITIDLKPALDQKTLDQRLLREINEHSRQRFKSLLKRLLPGKLASVFAEKLRIPEEKLLNQISSEERKRLRMLLKEFRLEVAGYRSFNEAIVTAGGISIKEINPKTMESKLVKGLYFVGEIIDVDADTGGFNLQAAFSTGWIAGRAVKTQADF